MRDAIILIFANKQDLPDGKWYLQFYIINLYFLVVNSMTHCIYVLQISLYGLAQYTNFRPYFFSVAMKPHEIQEKLGLTRIRDRNWYVQPSCATTGDGLYEGLTWLTSNHKLWANIYFSQISYIYREYTFALYFLF